MYRGSGTDRTPAQDRGGAGSGPGDRGGPAEGVPLAGAGAPLHQTQGEQVSHGWKPVRYSGADTVHLQGCTARNRGAGESEGRSRGAAAASVESGEAFSGCAASSSP